MSSTEYVKRTAYKPVDFFFRGVVDTSAKKVAYVDAFQILNDRFLGRMNVCNYFYIAENSVRINELNVIALDELKNYHLVMRQNFYIPENLVYSLPLTTRFLESDKDFDVLLATLTENGYKKNSIIIVFNANTMLHLDEDSRKRYARLKRLGYKICVSGFGAEYNSLDLFADFAFDYLRVEASYFDASQSKKKLLNMLVKFCSANKIKFVMEGVDTPAQMKRFKREGVKLVTGKAVSKLSRWVTNEFLGLSELTPDQRAAYDKKLSKTLDAIAKAERAEFEELRARAAERVKEELSSGKVMPGAPRPELIKSPYQVRLEQQKQAAKRAALKQLEKQAAEKELKKHVSEEYRERKMINDMTSGIFEGGIQSALAVTFAADEAKRRSSAGAGDTKETPETVKPDGKAKTKAEKELAKQKKLIGEISGGGLFGKLGNEAAAGGLGGFGVKLRFPVRERAPQDSDNYDDSAIEESADYNQAGALERINPQDNANTLENSDKTDSLSSSDSGLDNGVYQEVEERNSEKEINSSFEKENEYEYVAEDETEYEYIPDEEAEVSETTPDELVGEYNEKGQWVDEDGNVYNGYFDEDGNWTEYQEFDSQAEGSYNEDGQWVDEDGNVYDGYFDEQGRWIDYSFINAEGEKVDNGYFDNTLNKWVPFGYFDENGDFVKF